MINAIQQLGLGVLNKRAVLDWFARVLDFRTVIFDDEGDAKYMTRYTGDKVCRRDAALVLNKHGGSGLEIWQHTNRAPIPQPEDMSLRSTGFLICKIRCKGIEKIVERLQNDREESLQLIGVITERPTGEKCCYFSVFGTWFQLVEAKRLFFQESKGAFCAGVSGVIAGVGDMNNAVKFYRKILGYEHVVQDKEGEWSDWQGFEELNKLNIGRFRRVVLQREQPETGLYCSFLGVGEIELVEVLNSPLVELQELLKESLHLGKAPHLYKDRYWGDPGLIHLCFDVSMMNELQEYCQNLGVKFSVDTGDEFEMGNSASGRFAYLEDPDGSLIEFVETYRVPIMKKFGLSLKVMGKTKPLLKFLLKIAVRDNYSS